MLLRFVACLGSNGRHNFLIGSVIMFVMGTGRYCTSHRTDWIACDFDCFFVTGIVFFFLSFWVNSSMFLSFLMTDPLVFRHWWIGVWAMLFFKCSTYREGVISLLNYTSGIFSVLWFQSVVYEWDEFNYRLKIYTIFSFSMEKEKLLFTDIIKIITFIAYYFVILCIILFVCDALLCCIIHYCR